MINARALHVLESTISWPPNLRKIVHVFQLCDLWSLNL